jgi:hypothetical protein
MVVAVVGLAGMLVLFAFAAHKHNEALRKESDRRAPQESERVRKLAGWAIAAAMAITVAMALLASSLGLSFAVVLMIAIATAYATTWLSLFGGRWWQHRNRA